MDVKTERSPIRNHGSVQQGDASRTYPNYNRAERS